VVVGWLAVATGIHQATKAEWPTWWWGGAAFVAAQVARLPFVIAVAALAGVPLRGPAQPPPLWFTLAVVTPTAAVAEEGARWLAFRYPLAGRAERHDAAMEGAGQGGLSAVVVAGLGGFALLVDLSRHRSSALLLRTRPWHPLLTTPEQAVVVALHIVAALLVVRAVRDDRVRPLAGAVLLHAIVLAALATLNAAMGVVAPA